MQTFKVGVLYFAIVFGTGFVLGPIRIVWLVPRFGPRVAELMEMPIMLFVIVFSARWLVRGLAVPTLFSRLGMGCVALLLMLLAEFTLVLWLRGLTITDFFATRDPVAGTVYYVMLLIFAVMPLLVRRR